MSRRQIEPSNILPRMADPMPPLFPRPNAGDVYYNTYRNVFRIFLDDEWRDVVPEPWPLSVDDLSDVSTAVDPEAPWESPAGNLLGWNAVGRRWQPVQDRKGLAVGTFKTVAIPQASLITLSMNSPGLKNVTMPNLQTLELQLDGYWTVTARLEGFPASYSGTPRMFGSIAFTKKNGTTKYYRASAGFMEGFITVSATLYATVGSTLTFDAFTNVGASNIHGDFVVKYLGEN